MDCGAYRGVKLLEQELVKVDDMQFGFMPGKGTTDALFI